MKDLQALFDSNQGTKVEVQTAEGGGLLTGTVGLASESFVVLNTANGRLHVLYQHIVWVEV